MADDFATSMRAATGGWSNDPATWEPAVQAASKKYDIPANVFHALMHVESGHDAGAVGPAIPGRPDRAQGVGQFMPATSAALGINPWNPLEAIDGIGRTLSASKAANGGDLVTALREYQGGQDRSGWGPQNAAYVPKIMGALTSHNVDPATVGLGPADIKASPNGSFSVTARPGAAGTPGQPSGTPDDFETQMRNATRAVPDADVELAKLKAMPGSTPQNVQLPPGGLPPPPPNSNAGPGILETLGNMLKPPYAATPVGQSPTPNSGRAPTEYGPVEAFQNGALLGQGPRIAAAGQTIRNALGPGTSVGDAVQGLQTGFQVPPPQNGVQRMSPYQTALAQQMAGQAYFQTNSPITNALAEGAGAMVPTTLGMGAAGKAVQAGASALGGAVPAIAPALATAGSVLGGTAGAGVSGLPGAAIRVGSRAVNGAVQGAESGAIQSPLSSEDADHAALTGAKIGAVMNPVLGIVGAPIARMLNPQVDSELARLALTPEAAAVGLRGGQIAQGKGAKTLDKLFGSHSDTEIAEKFSEEVGNALGVTGGKLTRPAVERAMDVAGATLSRVANNTNIDAAATNAAGHNMFDRISQLQAQVNRMSDIDDGIRARLTRTLRQLDDDALIGIDGETYQEWTRYNGPLGRMRRSGDSAMEHIANQIRSLLDNQLEITATNAGNMADVTAMQQARGQYKGLLSLEKLANNSITGILSPPDVYRVLAANYRDLANSGTIGRLGQIGQLLARVSQEGDTAKPANLWSNLAQIRHGLAAAGIYGLHEAGLLNPSSIAMGVGGLGLAAGVHKAATAGLTSGSYRDRVARSALGGPPAITFPNPLLNPAVNAGLTPRNRP